MAAQHLTVLTVLLLGLEDVSCKNLQDSGYVLKPRQIQGLKDVSKANIDKSTTFNYTDKNSNVLNDNSFNSHVEKESMEASYRRSPIQNSIKESKSGFKTYAPTYYNPYSSNVHQNYYFPQYTPAPAPAEYPIIRPYLDTNSQTSAIFLADESNFIEDTKQEKEDFANFMKDSSLDDLVDLGSDIERRRYNQNGETPIFPHHTLPAPPVLTGSETFNMEGSEIGEATYIIPEELKGSISLPPPEPAQRTYGLTINDGSVVRKEVRNDYGEFSNSYISADGSRRTEIGELVVQPNGAQVLVLRGSYTYKSPDGKRYQVIYKADSTGYHAKQVQLN